LKRWKRYRGFPTKSARHRREQENYIFLRGLDCKSSSFLHGCCTEASCWPKLERFRPWESTGSGGKERGEGGGSIPCLTRSGDAPRRSNFARENSKVGSVLSGFCSCSWQHLGNRGRGKDSAQGKVGRSGDAHGHRSMQEREGRR
jgi:hypothetical protein